MGKTKCFGYWKDLGEAVIKHDDVSNMHGKLFFQYKHNFFSFV